MEEEKVQFTWFEIVKLGWREQYDREDGLGLVVVANPIKNEYWVAKILQDNDGFFVIPEVVCKSGNRLKKTDKKITNLFLQFETK